MTILCAFLIVVISAVVAHLAYVRVRERRGANPKRWLPGNI